MAPTWAADEGGPSRALDRVLLELAERCDLALVFRRDLVAGHQVRAPRPDETVDCRRRLQRLIAPFALEARYVASATAVLQPAAPQQASSAPGPARQQPSTPAAVPAPPPLEEMRVYGRSSAATRLARRRYEPGSRVEVVERAELELSGLESLAEVLQFLPAVAGNATSTRVSNGGDGSATVTLRGLPASHTLVLLNGRRLPPGPFEGRAVDLNAIPLAAVAHIEILRDGASAVHGSDAVAGVVNVVTRDDLDGLHLSAYGGRTSRGDLDTRHHSLVWGHQGSGGSLVLGLDYFDQAGIMSRDRGISRSADARGRGGIDRRSSATPQPRVRIDDASLILTDGAAGDAPEDFRPATREDRFDYRRYTTARVPFERLSLFGQGRLDLGARSSAFFEYLDSRTQAENLLAPAPLFTAYEALDLAVAADAVHNPFDVPVSDLRRRLLELGPRRDDTRTETRRGVVGVRFRGDDRGGQLHVSHGVARGSATLTNVVDGPALARGIGPADRCEAAASCVPVDLFGPPGSLDAEMVEFIATRNRSRARSSLTTVSASGWGSLGRLPAGPVDLAAGVEWRRATLDVRPDDLARAGGVVAGSNLGATRGERYVGEGYVELRLPLLADLPGIERLELDLADRYSRYSDFGHTHNPRLGLRYRPVPQLLLRASVGHGFRAPTLRELELEAEQSSDFLTDPCAAAAEPAVLPGCSGSADPSLMQFLTITGGESDLAAEQSRTRSIGAVWTPPWVPGRLTLALDAFAIEEENVVGASAQYIVDRNARSGRFAERVQRDAEGNLARVTATNLNLGRREVRGLDASVDWRSPGTLLGAFELALDASHIARYVDQLDPHAPTVDQAGTFRDAAAEGNGALPDWKVNLGLAWYRGAWRGRWQVRYVGTLDEVVPYSGEAREIDAWVVHDAQVAYRFGGRRDVELGLGAHNLTDEPPPFSAAAFNDGFDGRTYDLAGRFIYLRVDVGLDL